MYRRTFLALLGSAGIAGCLGQPQGETDGDDGANPASRSPDGGEVDEHTVPLAETTLADELDADRPVGGFPTLTVAGDDVPGRGDVEFLVGVAQQYSAGRLARLQIDLVNRGSDSLAVDAAASPPFSSYRSEPSSPDGGHALLAPVDAVHAGITPVEGSSEAYGRLQAPVDGCWAIDGVGWNSIARDVEIPSEHLLSRRYDVYADASNDGCLPAGEYRFEDSWGVRGESTSLEWGFTLEVDDTEE